MTKLYATVHRRYDDGVVGNVYAMAYGRTGVFAGPSSPYKPAKKVSVAEALAFMKDRATRFPNAEYFMRTCDE